MSQNNLSKMLKLITILTGLIGLIIYFVIIPVIGRDVAVKYLSGYYWQWIIFLWLSGIPCYIVLVKFWKICCEIKNDNSFSEINARRLSHISVLTLVDVGYFFIGNVVLLFINMSHPVIFFGSLIVNFFGIAISVVAAALSRLVYKAADMKNENELTI
ncbi:UNVERIFIED_CONTAM: Protein of unknown function (DUF2975) [Acetivibrio alkalicellulosi]